MNHDRPEHLTPREMQVLTLLAMGTRNRDIASQIGIAEKTVHTHRTHALKKLRLRNNVELARYATAAGIVPAPEPIVTAPAALASEAA